MEAALKDVTGYKHVLQTYCFWLMVQDKNLLQNTEQAIS